MSRYEELRAQVAKLTAPYLTADKKMPEGAPAPGGRDWVALLKIAFEAILHITRGRSRQADPAN